MYLKTAILALIASIGLVFTVACGEQDQQQEIEMPARPGEMPPGYEPPREVMPDGEPGHGMEPQREPQGEPRMEQEMGPEPRPEQDPDQGMRQ